MNSWKKKSRKSHLLSALECRDGFIAPERRRLAYREGFDKTNAGPVMDTGVQHVGELIQARCDAISIKGNDIEIGGGVRSRWHNGSFA